MAGKSNPALTFTLSDFIEAGKTDQLTYTKFSLVSELNGVKYASFNIVADYLDVLKKICVQIPRENITQAQIAKYKYNPDLLAYDIYGSTQLEFIVLYANNIIDPKEFDFHNRYLYLPRASVLQRFLSDVYNAEYDILGQSSYYR